MLQSLFRRAEAKVDNAIANVLLRAFVALPFIVAVGFGTAALAIYAYDYLGVLLGNIVLAGLFSVIGLILAAVVAVRNHAPHVGEAQLAGAEEQTTETEPKQLFDPMDREVVSAMASAVAPLALPLLVRPVMRNLPLIAAIAAAGYVLTRSGGNASSDVPPAEPALQPAE